MTPLGERHSTVQKGCIRIGLDFCASHIQLCRIELSILHNSLDCLGFQSPHPSIRPFFTSTRFLFHSQACKVHCIGKAPSSEGRKSTETIRDARELFPIEKERRKKHTHTHTHTSPFADKGRPFASRSRGPRPSSVTFSLARSGPRSVPGGSLTWPLSGCCAVAWRVVYRLLRDHSCV